MKNRIAEFSRYGLLGFPLGHSFSATYFTSKFRKENLESMSYEHFEFEKMDEFLNNLKADHSILGFNVTIPHKKNIIPWLQEIHGPAKEINAVNTVVVSYVSKQHYLKGYNTDVVGFKMLLESVTGKGPFEKAFILGTGGSAHAVAYVLSERNIEWKMVSRNPTISQLSYNDAQSALTSGRILLVNCTPVGMFPEVNKSPLGSFKKFHKNITLLDLIYNPAETLLMQHVRKKGAVAVNGYKMLIEQAEASWQLWKQASNMP